MDTNKQEEQKKPPTTEISDKPRHINIEKYKDPEGLTVKRMQIGLWYIEHRRHLTNIFIGILIAVTLLSWAFTLYGFGYYLFRGMIEDDILAAQLANTSIIGHDYLKSIAAQDLVYFTPQILRADSEKYDFLVQVRNVNKKHWGEFEYTFMAGNTELEKGRGFILPGESKYIVSLAHPLPAGSASARFRADNIRWRRIDPRKIEDWDKFKREHFDIKVDEIEFTSAPLSGLSDKINLNRLEFQTTNDSAYSFWDVDFIILLYRQNVIIGVNQYTLGEFMSGETREIRASWPGSFGKVDSVEIFPEVNILDDRVYIAPIGEIGNEK